ncbi:YncE family protein [Microbacter margulisiae]|uniref:YVTN family beta-propeller protein n=1 Tax=Microbacter margulisiae TaxID=1350067 RepID=A0A7W5DQ20_9PORP|nr:YncE family protein [Microbacter margulisiae]MBB3186926.1 YVTN family beta-propeller protein [Microbacter margulisiae]
MRNKTWRRSIFWVIICFSFYASGLVIQAAPKRPLQVNTTHPIWLTNNRAIASAGKQVFFGDSLLENHAMDAALSPGGKWLAIEERYSLVIVNTITQKVVYTLPLKDIEQIPKVGYGAMNTYSGIRWNRIGDENRITWSAVGGNIAYSYVIQVMWNGHKATVKKIFTYKAQAPAETALPNEVLIRDEKGKDMLYVVLNGNNQLVKQDLKTGDTIWIAPTGVAPYGIALANNKLYVTDWAGRTPDKDDPNVAGVPWGEARIDTTNAATREGSVSVIDPESGKVLKNIVVGLHPNKIVASPDGQFVYLTNSNSDAVSVINTFNDAVVETIPVRLQSNINDYFGDSPNGLAVSAGGHKLYVAVGMDNAIAIISLGKKSCSGGTLNKSVVDGFIPTGYYPSSINIKSGKIKDRKELFVTNIEADGPNRPFYLLKGEPAVYNTHHMLASISIIDMPGKAQLARYTRQVIALNQLRRLQSAQLPPRKGIAPRPLPARIGEPSVFKHVLYIIRENRTYDQVLGDVKTGNGDAQLCTFGKEITPNAHQLVKDYLLLDNYMASGKCSAEGHQWTDASIVTDYIEKNVRAWFRSYPHVQTDALVYAPSGFLWDNARKHGVSVEIFGEACIPHFDPKLTWSDIYNNFIKGNPFKFTNVTTLNTVKPLLSPTYPGYDSHKIPDAVRADAFVQELKHYEAMSGDSLPQLMILALPADHTAGMAPGFPTPRAMVADNDYALGKIIDAFTNSKFYKNSVIFVTEDDSQDGWDHVSAFRTVGLVISPYSRLHKTISTAYNQPSIVRTIEQILGLPPMNIEDAIATPMWNCFTQKPDYSPYYAIPNRIPLNEMNKPLTALSGAALHFAKLSLEPQFAGIDTGNDDLLNRIIWFSAKGTTPYPTQFAGKDSDDN